MGFRKKINVLRCSPGEFNDDGNYQEGKREIVNITASLQPLNRDDLTLFSDDGGRTPARLKLYTSTELYPYMEENELRQGIKGDVVLYLERHWQVVKCDPFQSGVISHYRAYVQEVFEIESVSEKTNT